MKTKILRIFIAFFFACAISFAAYYLIFPEFRYIVGCYISLLKPKPKPPKISFIRIDSTSAIPKEIKMPDSIYFFVRYGYTESLFLVLSKDSSYQTIIRMHFGGAIYDKGTWSITNQGKLALNSSRYYPKLWVDETTYLENDSNVINELPTIADKIVTIIKQTKGDSIKFTELKIIHRKFTHYSKERIGKKNLEVFVKQIKDYLTSNEKSVFHYQPINYKGYIALLELDEHWYTPQKRIIKICESIDMIGKYIPINTYLAISKAQLKYETGIGEPFKFVKGNCE